MKFHMGKNKLARIFSFIVAPFFLVSVIFGQGKQIPLKFNPPRLVSDYVDLLTTGQFQSLENKLVAYNDSTSTQIAIVIERSTEGEDIFSYSQRLAEDWGIGQTDKDNGVLILVTTEDRKLRIHTGYGAEIFLTDAMSKRIIDKVIIPNFRKGNYYTGLDKASDIIMQLGSGEYTSSDEPESKIPVLLIVIFIIILIIVISIIASRFDAGNDGGYWSGGRYGHYGPQKRNRSGRWIIIPGTGSFGGGGFGGGGFGGFGGFGGGSFGGGGASGSW